MHGKGDMYDKGECVVKGGMHGMGVIGRGSCVAGACMAGGGCA